MKIPLAAATTSNENDARIILMALRDEYLKRKRERVTADSKRAKDAALGRKNAAEKRIKDVEILIASQLKSEPLETLQEGKTEAAAQVNLLVHNFSEYSQTLDSIAASRAQLLERDEKGDFEPSEEERLQVATAYVPQSVRPVVRVSVVDLLLREQRKAPRR